MNEKKHARLIKACRVIAVILAVLMILGVFLQGFM